MADRVANTPLASAKHEAFCRAIVQGISGREAYRRAGYTKATDGAADSNASRLLKNAQVSARIAELKASAADATVMNLNEVLQELSKLGRSDIRNCIVGGDDTAEVISSVQDLPAEHSAAIRSIVVDTYMEGSGDDAREVKRVRLELHDKKGALSELRRHYEPQKHADPDGRALGSGAAEAAIERLSELELARRIAFALELGARARGRDTIAGQAPMIEAKPAPKRKRTPKPKAAAAPAAPTPAPAEQPKKD